MPLATITNRISQKLAHAPHLNARVKFDFGADGTVFVDATRSPPNITNEDAESDVTLSCTIETFNALLDGTQDPNIAFMMGKLKVKGSMGLAMKLNAILEE
jgi:putative sterol carrier protein